MSDARLFAVTGKGGVGKTSVCAAMIWLLVRAYPEKRILAVDADPAVGLSTALGVEPGETLDGLRESLSAEVAENTQRTGDILAGVRQRLLHMLQRCEGFDFFAIGRPEAAGCYCAVNTYLRQVLGLLMEDYDYVVVDCEAGVEQVNRRALERVTDLLLVSDASQKGLRVIQTIRGVADELTMYERCGAILNRVGPETAAQPPDLSGIPLLAVIGEDEAQMEYDIFGRSVFDLPDGAEILRGTARALKALGVL